MHNAESGMSIPDVRSVASVFPDMERGEYHDLVRGGRVPIPEAKALVELPERERAAIVDQTSFDPKTLSQM